jgi:hypothetical protein
VLAADPPRCQDHIRRRQAVSHSFRRSGPRLGSFGLIPTIPHDHAGNGHTMDRAQLHDVLDVKSGWEPSIHGGYGWGGPPAPLPATRMVPNLPITEVPELPPGGYGGFPGCTEGGFTEFVSGPLCVPLPRSRACVALQRNIAPRTREQRRNQTNKDALEKARLREVSVEGLVLVGL